MHNHASRLVLDSSIWHVMECAAAAPESPFCVSSRRFPGTREKTCSHLKSYMATILLVWWWIFTGSEFELSCRVSDAQSRIYGCKVTPILDSKW